MFKRCFALMLAMCLLLTGSSVAFMEELSLDTIPALEALPVDESVLQAEEYVEEQTEAYFGSDEEQKTEAYFGSEEMVAEPAVEAPAAEPTAEPAPVVAAEASDTIAQLAMTGNAKYTLNRGSRLQITLPEGTTAKFSSSKKKIATVTKAGLVTAKDAGKAKITVTMGKKKWTLTVTVIDTTIPTKVYLTKDGAAVSGTITVSKGQPITLVPVAQSASGAADTGYKWTTSKKKVATVSKNGVVTPKSEGTTKITVTTTRGKKKASIKVKVADPYKATSVALSETGLIYVFLKETRQLSATMQPENATSTLTWSTSNKKVATVSKKGVITGKKKGKAKITVKTSSGKKASVTVKVIPRGGSANALNFEFAQDETVYTGELHTLELSTDPIDADADIVWTTSDSNILYVSGSRRKSDLKFQVDVVGKNVGATTLTATDSKTGNSESVVISVLEPPAPQAMSLPNGGSVTMSVGEKRDIPYLVTPATSLSNSNNAAVVEYDPSLVNILYDSENWKRNCLGTMDYNLHITAKAAGTTTVTIKLKNGVSASFTLVIQ